MEKSYYSTDEINSLSFKSVGNDVLISRFARFYEPQTIEIGNNVRIDDFCILSGDIKLGDNIHISAYSALYGKFGIEMEDYCGISPRCTIFSAIDDFSGEFLIGPLVYTKFTNILKGKVIIKRFSQVGCNSVVFPNVIINEGVAVGALSLVNSSLESWGIYAGIPVKKIKNRSKNLLKYIY